MKFKAFSDPKKRTRSDMIVVPVFQGGKGGALASKFKEYAKHIDLPLKTDFKGKAGSTLLVYLSSGKDDRLLLLGLGKEKECTVESLRRSYSAFVKRARGKKWKTFSVVVPEIKGLSEEEVVKGLSEGINMTSYAFEEYKLPKNQENFAISTVNLIGASKDGQKVATKASKIQGGVNLARDLVNGNADDVTPLAMADQAQELAKEFKSVTTKILDEKALEKENMGLLLAVGRASKVGSRLIIMEYKGNPKSKEKSAVVGKGMSYDSGGLNLKPTGFMETMKADMGGAAAVFGFVKAAATLGIKQNFVAVVASTENNISGDSYKPGDVYYSRSGDSVEVINTDAEGRLILADALDYVQDKYSPKRIINLATLTGAIQIAVGLEYGGLFGNNAEWNTQIKNASNDCWDKVWEFPMDAAYKESLKSDIADIKNCGNRSGSCITAAKFLEHFIKGKTPWAHLDIASVAYIDKPRRYHVTNATGFGVRLLTELFEQL